MELKLEQLSRHLQGPLAPLYVLHGDEALLQIEARDALREVAQQAGFLARESHVVESGFQWSTLLFANDAMSLFADRKFIELAIPSGKPGTQGSEALQQLSQSLNPDNLLLITLPRLDKATQSSKWFQALQQAGVTIATPPVERHALPAWLNGRLAKQKQQLDAAGLTFLAERVEGNLLAAHQEVQKLALLYPEGAISEAQVREAVLNVARFDVFQLSEAVLQGDTARFLRMLDGLKAEGEAPTLVLWSLNEDAHLLYRVAHGLAQGQALPALLRENRVWGDKQQWLGPAARRLDGTTLRRALSLCAEADRASKGVSPHDPWLLLSQLGLLLCGAPVLQTWAG